MMSKTLECGMLAVLVAVTACGGTANADHDGTDGAGADTQMAGMAGMPGMAAGTGSTTERLMHAMDSSLQRTDGASVDNLSALLPAHRSALANLIAEMNYEMRVMGMTGDAIWTATIDTLRRDLVALADMRPAELVQAMPAHRARVQRLSAMHRTMMRHMKM